MATLDVEGETVYIYDAPRVRVQDLLAMDPSKKLEQEGEHCMLTLGLANWCYKTEAFKQPKAPGKPLVVDGAFDEIQVVNADGASSMRGEIAFDFKCTQDEALQLARGFHHTLCCKIVQLFKRAEQMSERGLEKPSKVDG